MTVLFTSVLLKSSSMFCQRSSLFNCLSAMRESELPAFDNPIGISPEASFPLPPVSKGLHGELLGVSSVLFADCLAGVLSYLRAGSNRLGAQWALPASTAQRRCLRRVLSRVRLFCADAGLQTQG